MSNKLCEDDAYSHTYLHKIYYITEIKSSAVFFFTAVTLPLCVEILLYICGKGYCDAVSVNESHSDQLRLSVSLFFAVSGCSVSQNSCNINKKHHTSGNLLLLHRNHRFIQS